MMQGDQYRIPFEILVEDGAADYTVFDDVEIVIGSIRKTMSKGEVTFRAEDKCFLFPLTQEESFFLPNKASVQVRVKLNATGEVVGVSLGQIDVERTLSEAVL